MIVAGLQLDIAWEDPAENFRRTEALVGEAVDRGGRVLALPELFATGFSMRSEAMAAHAVEVRTFLAGIAARCGVWVIGGYAEPGVERPANACGVFAPDGDRIGQIRLPEICSNLCFGGQKRNRLFMTGSQSLYAVYTEAQGAHIT